MDIKLNIAILSHLNDLQYDIYDNQVRAETRTKFIRSLIFHNEDTTIRVETEYLDFMYQQADRRGAYDCSYEEWLAIRESDLIKL
jgi:hypothetical protein